MSSSENDPPHCDHETCKIELPHCHICDKTSCGIDHPHCHVCGHEETPEGSAPTPPDLASARNDTQVGSAKYQATLLQQMRRSEERSETPPSVGSDTPPEVVYRSAQWQPSYAMGGGTDLTRMLRPTAHRTFSWGGPGSSVTIPSPDDSGSSSAPESRGEDSLKRRVSVSQLRDIEVCYADNAYSRRWRALVRLGWDRY
jgi:hypothetical protein